MTVDLVGRKFGRVTVVKQSPYRNKGSVVWECSCRCGATAFISSRDLLHADRKGCGNCADTKHPLYGIWRGIIARCTDTNSPSYKDYGGRGITICQEWKEEFLAFVEDMGPRPEGYSVERKDNEGNYNKDNCKWATAQEQAYNKRELVAKLTDQDLVDIYHADRSLPSKLVADSYGVSAKTILNIRCKQHGRARMEAALKKLTPQPITIKL